MQQAQVKSNLWLKAVVVDWMLNKHQYQHSARTNKI